MFMDGVMNCHRGAMCCGRSVEEEEEAMRDWRLVFRFCGREWNVCRCHCEGGVVVVWIVVIVCGEWKHCYAAHVVACRQACRDE